MDLMDLLEYGYDSGWEYETRMASDNRKILTDIETQLNKSIMYGDFPSIKYTKDGTKFDIRCLDFQISYHGDNKYIDFSVELEKPFNKYPEVGAIITFGQVHNSMYRITIIEDNFVMDPYTVGCRTIRKYQAIRVIGGTEMTKMNYYDYREMRNKERQREKGTITVRKNGGYESLDIEKVIFNDPATIVYWSDGTRTVVKVRDLEAYDPDTGLAMCICKKIYGKNFHHIFKKFTKKYWDSFEEEDEEEGETVYTLDDLAASTFHVKSPLSPSNEETLKKFVDDIQKAAESISDIMMKINGGK